MISNINIVIFASREDFHTLRRTVLSVLDSAPAPSIIDVLINGNLSLAEQLAEWMQQNPTLGHEVNIWHIPYADKANAWNQHIHSIWRGDMHSIYMDGYIRVSQPSIYEIVKTLNMNLSAIGSSGIPTHGLSSKKLQEIMNKEGGFHGNLCSLKSEAIAILKQRKIQIPVGMYRVDSIMGAFLSFNLDNLANQWNPKKYIPVTANASWEIDEKKFYRLKDIKSWFKRRQRQAQGDIENLAVKYHLTVKKIPLECLPSDLKALFYSWKTNDVTCTNLLNSFGRRHKNALNLIENFKLPLENELQPNLINSVK